MKFYNIILFASLILYILSSDCDGKDAESAKDCKDLTSAHTDGKCCFIKGVDVNKNSVSACFSLKKSDYDDIDAFIKSYEDKGADIDKVDCKSIYLELSILSFILLLL